MLVLKKRREFLLLNRKAARVHLKGFVLQVLPSVAPEQPARFGFTVTKRIGNAVVRNRVKRRMRALCREILTSADWQQRLRGHDFVLIARPETPTFCYQSLLESLRHGLTKGLRKAHTNNHSHRIPA